MHAYLPCSLLAAQHCEKLSLLPFFANSAAELVKPFWKNIQMIAIMARRLLANKAYYFAVIRPMLLRSVKVRPVYSIRLQKATIWSQPASGNLKEATKPFGTSESLMPMDGDRQPPSFEHSRTK